MNVKEDMLKKKKEINEKTEIFIFVFLAFILLTTWAMTQPFNSGPDEQMRYYVADYIYKHHGALPGGDDPAVRNKVWGISYAYYPVVSYMVSALFMRISRLFADPGYSMFKIARMADVLFVTGAVYFVVKASGKLFPKEKYSREVRWLFAALAGFMPQAKAKEIRKIAEGIIALGVKECNNYDTVTVTAKVARKDKDGKRVKEVVDGKKVTQFDEVEKEIRKDQPSRLHARRKMQKVLYNITEVPAEMQGRKSGTKTVDVAAFVLDDLAPKYAERNGNGGYTRIVKIGQRKGDAAMQVLIELV